MYRHRAELKKEAAARGKSVSQFKRTADYVRWNENWYSDASNRGSSILAGGASAAYRAATTKDGKIIAGAAEGAKGAVDARNTRDKRENAEYTFLDRAMDSIRSSVGVDTVAKTKANELRTGIERLNAQAYTHQQNASDQLREMQSILHRVISQSELDDWMKNDRAVDATVRQQFDAYKASVNEYTNIRRKIAKDEKTLGLYEQEKK